MDMGVNMDGHVKGVVSFELGGVMAVIQQVNGNNGCSDCQVFPSAFCRFCSLLLWHFGCV